MAENLLEAKLLVVGLWFAGFFLLERARPASPWVLPNSVAGFTPSRHFTQNALLWAINLVVAPLLMIAITAPVAAMASSWRPQLLSGVPGLLLDLVILDCWIYWWHRANHHFPFLWRFHKIHHFDQQLDVSSAVRFHFGEVALSALFRTPVILLFGMSISSILIFETLVLMAAIFHHSNLKLSPGLEGRLSRFIITPSIHWVHHHALRSATDSNYGTLLSGWDRLFCSLSGTPRTPSMVLGIEGQSENRIPRLLMMPFTKKVAEQ